MTCQIWKKQFVSELAINFYDYFHVNDVVITGILSWAESIVVNQTLGWSKAIISMNFSCDREISLRNLYHDVIPDPSLDINLRKFSVIKKIDSIGNTWARHHTWYLRSLSNQNILMTICTEATSFKLSFQPILTNKHINFN